MSDRDVDARLLEIVNWGLYREEVYLAVCDGVRHYVERRKGSSAGPIVQAFLWTDPSTHHTGFELLTYDTRVQLGAFRVIEVEGELQRVPIGPAGYGGWDFARFHVIVNESLSPLSLPEWRADERLERIEARIGTELGVVRSQIEEEGVLLNLPRRGQFIFEIDWLFD